MSRRRGELKAKLAGALAARASRNRGPLDRLCRKLLDRALKLPPEEDFLRDEWVDKDRGFDPEELERYQRGD